MSMSKVQNETNKLLKNTIVYFVEAYKVQNE